MGLVRVITSKMILKFSLETAILEDYLFSDAEDKLAVKVMKTETKYQPDKDGNLVKFLSTLKDKKIKRFETC